MKIKNIKIKIANFNDLQTLQAIIDSAFKGSTQEGLGQLSNGILLNSGTYYYASMNDIPLSCGGFTIEEPGTCRVEDGIAHIRNFATHPTSRRLGLAREIMKECEKQAKKINIEKFICFSSLEGEYFYKQNGFIENNRKTIYIGNRALPIIIMEKNLHIKK